MIKSFRTQKAIQKYEAYSVLMFVPHHLHIKVQWCSGQHTSVKFLMVTSSIPSSGNYFSLKWMGMGWIGLDS